MYSFSMVCLLLPKPKTMEPVPLTEAKLPRVVEDSERADEAREVLPSPYELMISCSSVWRV